MPQLKEFLFIIHTYLVVFSSLFLTAIFLLSRRGRRLPDAPSQIPAGPESAADGAQVGSQTRIGGRRLENTPKRRSSRLIINSREMVLAVAGQRPLSRSPEWDCVPPSCSRQDPSICRPTPSTENNEHARNGHSNEGRGIWHNAALFPRPVRPAIGSSKEFVDHLRDSRKCGSRYSQRAKHHPEKPRPRVRKHSRCSRMLHGKTLMNKGEREFRRSRISCLTEMGVLP